MTISPAAFDTLIGKIEKEEIGQLVDHLGRVVGHIVFLRKDESRTLSPKFGSSTIPPHTRSKLSLQDPHSQVSHGEGMGSKSQESFFGTVRKAILPN